jgi:hypothetical protein
VAIFHIERAVFGDRDPMRLATDVAQHLFWAGKRRLGIDHPRPFPHRHKVPLEGVAILQIRKGGEGVQFAGVKGALEHFNEATAKEPREHPNR